MSSTQSHYKVLPFETEQGKVTGHEITTHHYDWMDDKHIARHISKVIFERWDEKAGMMIENHVHYQRVTEYMKKLWPQGGRVTGVTLTNGRIVHAEGISVAHYNSECYLAAPLIARDTFLIRALGGGDRLVEVRGVSQWCQSKRDAAATEKFLACPWARDNAEYQKRQAELL